MLQNSLLLKGDSLTYNFMGCFGVEFVQFQCLLLEASGDLFFYYSLRAFQVKAEPTTACFLISSGSQSRGKVHGNPAPQSQEWGISRVDT